MHCGRSKCSGWFVRSRIVVNDSSHSGMAKVLDRLMDVAVIVPYVVMIVWFAGLRDAEISGPVEKQIWVPGIAKTLVCPGPFP